MKAVFAGVLVIALSIGGIFGLQYLGFLSTSFFAPKYEGVRRDVMIESRAYTEASIRRLYDLKREYEKADDADARRGIALTARHEFSIFPQDRLPPDLRIWMAQINR